MPQMRPSHGELPSLRFKAKIPQLNAQGIDTARSFLYYRDVSPNTVYYIAKSFVWKDSVLTSDYTY